MGIVIGLILHGFGLVKAQDRKTVVGSLSKDVKERIKKECGDQDPEGKLCGICSTMFRDMQLCVEAKWAKQPNKASSRLCNLLWA